MSEAGKTEALMLAHDLPLNESKYAECPTCQGRMKFSVTRTREGVVWNCFRDSCDERGFSPTMGELVEPKRKPQKLIPWRYPILPLEPQDRQYFWDRFHLDPQTIEHVLQRSHDGRYVFHVQDWRRYTRGYVIRQPAWDGEPKPPISGTPDDPKAKVRMHATGPGMAWYPTGNPKLVLVEDCLSAMRAQQSGVSACALLGTNLDADMVREISVWRPSEVIIALDADATQTAFKLARKWGLAFPKTRVAVLEVDLKDEEPGEIHYALGL